MYASDLKAGDFTNAILKYADDSTLLIPELCVVTIEDELESMKQWSIANDLLLNITKIGEILFRKPNVRLDLLPDCLWAIECCMCVKLLGVVIDSRMTFCNHVDYLIKSCNQRMYPSRINAMFKKACRWNITRTLYNFDDLLFKADSRLFLRCLSSTHCLHHILPTEDTYSQMTLRPIGHARSLPRFKYQLTQKYFILRALYAFR